MLNKMHGGMCGCGDERGKRWKKEKKGEVESDVVL